MWNEERNCFESELYEISAAKKALEVWLGYQTEEVFLNGTTELIGLRAAQSGVLWYLGSGIWQGGEIIFHPEARSPSSLKE